MDPINLQLIWWLSLIFGYDQTIQYSKRLNHRGKTTMNDLLGYIWWLWVVLRCALLIIWRMIQLDVNDGTMNGGVMNLNTLILYGSEIHGQVSKKQQHKDNMWYNQWCNGWKVVVRENSNILQVHHHKMIPSSNHHHLQFISLAHPLLHFLLQLLQELPTLLLHK